MKILEVMQLKGLASLIQQTGGHSTKTDSAYAALREAIYSGLLAPGQHVVIQRVARELGMSSIPVREALRRLERDGLISITPHIGAVVRELPTHELEENLMIREQLEALAARLAARHISDDELQQLKLMVDEMDECVERADSKAYGKINREFHLRLYRTIPYDKLYRLIESLWDEVPRARSVFTLAPEYMPRSQEEHRSLLDALKRRDEAEAERITRQQKESARRALLAVRREADDNKNLSVRAEAAEA